MSNVTNPDADTVDGYEGHAPTKSAHDAMGIDADTVDGSHASELGETVVASGQVSVASGGKAQLYSNTDGTPRQVAMANVSGGGVFREEVSYNDDWRVENYASQSGTINYEVRE